MSRFIVDFKHDLPFDDLKAAAANIGLPAKQLRAGQYIYTFTVNRAWRDTLMDAAQRHPAVRFVELPIDHAFASGCFWRGLPLHFDLALVSDILDLRLRELRKGEPADAAHMDHDDDRDTLHFTLRAGDPNTGEVIGCVSLMPSEFWDNVDSYQLRGFAIASKAQFHGLGRAFAEYVETYAFASPFGGFLWCNARDGAIPFYQKIGWEVMSDEFNCGNQGSHSRMAKVVPRKY